jgi:hypothetical protein
MPAYMVFLYATLGPNYFLLFPFLPLGKVYPEMKSDFHVTGLEGMAKN